MLKLLIFILFLFGLCMIAFLCHQLVIASKYDKEERYFHCRYLAIFSICILIIFNPYVYTYVLLIIDKLVNLTSLQNIWNLVLPMRRFEAEYLLLVLIITNISLFILIGNVFLITKLIFQHSNQFIDTRDMPFYYKILHLPWVITLLFYKEDDEKNEFVVTEKGFTIGLWVKTMKWGFAVALLAEVIFLVVCIFKGSDALIEHIIKLIEGWYMLPMAGFLFLEQIQFFLERELEFDAGSYGTEDIEERLEGNLGLLLQIYEKEFENSDALIQTYVENDYHIEKDGLVHNGLNRNQIEQCKQPEILVILHEQLKEVGVNQNTMFQNAIIALLNGESINVRDFVQGEFLIYIVAYMNFFIAQEKTFLILCENKERGKLIKEEILNAFKRINKLYNIWKIADIDQADSNEEMSILICSYKDLIEHKVVEKRKEFFDSLMGIILADSLYFCSQGNVQKELFFSILENIRKNVQYILLSEVDNDSLRTAFESYIGKEIVPYKNDYKKNRFCVMAWKEESYNRIQICLGIGGKQTPYMGVSIPLALVAVKYDIPYISICAENGKGYYTYQDAMKMNMQENFHYLGINLDLEKMIHINDFSVEERSEIEIIILYDSEFNFFNLLWTWMKYGGTELTMIHIVSPVYMLREFFADNFSNLLEKSSDFNAIFSYQSNLKYTRFLEILLQLCNGGMSEEKLLQKNIQYKWNYKNVLELLEDGLKNVLLEEEFYNVYECLRFEEVCIYDEKKDQYCHQTLVSLIDENIEKRIREKIDFAKLMTKDDKESQLPILKDDIYNYYLKGQVIVINGYIYQVREVKDGLLMADQIATMDKREYMQVSEFTFKNLAKSDECVDLDILDLNLCVADVKREIYGYWESTNQFDFYQHSMVKFKSVCDESGYPIIMDKKQVQVMQIRMKKRTFSSEDRAQKAMLLLAFMIQEIFKTLYPRNYMNLFVVAERMREERNYWKNFLQYNSEITLGDKVQSLIPNVLWDEEREKNDEYIEFYIVEFTALERGLLSSLYMNRIRLFQIIESYLEWYLEKEEEEEENKKAENENIDSQDEAEDKTDDINNEEEENKDMSQKSIDYTRKIKPTYLNFGADKPASCFELEELLVFIKRILPVYKKEQKRQSFIIDVKEGERCSFCGKPMLFSYNMNDGRKMCRSCKQQQITQREEIKVLYQETKQLLEKGYHIDLPKGINIRLKSAETIRKRRQTSGGGRVLGFYQPKGRELWIEARGPRNAVQDTMIHELTHAWQFENIDAKALYKKGNEEALEILEGHSSYMEVDAMRKLGEENYAQYLESQLMLRQDEYGEGYRMLRDILKNAEQEGSHLTPYEAMKKLVGEKKKKG